ncbi:MAG TPA: hypothetical protein VJB05_02445 [archaeon]|nr:hypothetical protein [archaeon]
MDFLYPLRILAERQLTSREIGWAQEGKAEDLPGDVVRSYHQHGDKLVISYTQHFTDHMGVLACNPLALCLFERETRTYTSDGKLTEISIEDHNGVREKTKYNPPGRFIGKTQKEKKAA